jgi:hypothetical protein
MIERPTAEIGSLILAAIQRCSVFPASYSPLAFLQTVRAGAVSHAQFLPTTAIVALLKLKSLQPSPLSRW